jgi:hypothetical protein
MKRRKDEVPQPFYVVMNQNGQVYVGLKGGKPEYSDKWSDYKPLHECNTTLLRFLDSKIELIKEEEFIN